MTTHDIGFVYVMTNPAMPAMVKIGFTTLLPEDRAAQLSNRTNLPLPFEVAFRAFTMRWRAVESLVHKRLQNQRVSPRREFFSVSTLDAIQTVRESILDVNGIEAWDTGALRRPHLIGGRDRLALSLQAGDVFVVLTHTEPKPSYDDDDGWRPVDLWQAHASGDQLEVISTTGEHETAGFSDGDTNGSDDPIPHLDRNKRVSNGVLIGRERLAPGDRLLWLADNEVGCRSSLFEAADYCQVICRTWNPQATAEGLPLVLNQLVRDPSSAMLSATRDIISLPEPRNWGPRTPELRQAPTPVAPERWLPQLHRPASRQRK